MKYQQQQNSLTQFHNCIKSERHTTVYQIICSLARKAEFRNPPLWLYLSQSCIIPEFATIPLMRGVAHV